LTIKKLEKKLERLLIDLYRRSAIHCAQIYSRRAGQAQTKVCYYIMKYHKDLTLKDWKKLTLIEQMANVGADIERAIIFTLLPMRQEIKKRYNYNCLYYYDLFVRT